jgi:trimeric autotransporter adhesin
MTVEQQVDALATSVDELKAAVVTKKATLDASVGDAQSATSQAQSAKANALSARDQAAAFKDAAYTAAQSAASAVAYQDLTALAGSKAVTAVDVFVYDTSKDSDGGAWRNRCAGTSWYNEALNTAIRGSRREFPAVAVIVAESNKVTIYDGDDPALPMWMVFEGSWSYGTGKMLVLASTEQAPIKTVAMHNAVLAVGTSHSSVSGIHIIDFIKERARLAQGSASGYNNYTNHPNIAQRNAGLGVPVGNTLGSIVNSAVNDVAMTVLPDAPIDPATGLPVPTIAVATAGGVSVITDSGAVYDTTIGFTPVAVISFDDEGGLWWYRNNSLYLTYADVDDYTAADNFGDIVASNLVGNQEFDLRVGSNATALVAPQDGNVAIGGTGFGRHYLNTSALVSAEDTHLHAYITSTYNTGWMPGDIKGAFLSSKDTTSLVGGNSVVNGSGGTFDTTSGVSGQDLNVAVASVGGELEVTLAIGGSSNYANTSFPTIPGHTHTLSIDARAGSNAANVYVQVRDPDGSTLATSSTVTDDTVTVTFVAKTAVSIVRMYVTPSTRPAVGYFDNLVVPKLDADRSVNNKGLVVNGTITRTPVATGAELVRYNIGNGPTLTGKIPTPFTGTLCAMGWFRNNGSGDATIAFIGDAASTLPTLIFAFRQSSSGFEVLDYSSVFIAQASTPSWNSQWAFHAVIFDGTNAKLYVNGSLVGEDTNVSVRNYPSGINFTLGDSRPDGAVRACAAALFRISATAPTADQIRRIYEDEKALFQENAACTLYGASDAVTALAHDPDTGLLHVGTSAGRSVFKGLRRVANTTVPVGAAIAAAGGMVVEE